MLHLADIPPFWNSKHTPESYWFGPIWGGLSWAGEGLAPTTWPTTSGLWRKFQTFFVTNADFSKAEMSFWTSAALMVLVLQQVGGERVCVGSSGHGCASVDGGSISPNDFISFRLALMNSNKEEHARAHSLRGQNFSSARAANGVWGVRAFMDPPTLPNNEHKLMWTLIYGLSAVLSLPFFYSSAEQSIARAH